MIFARGLGLPEAPVLLEDGSWLVPMDYPEVAAEITREVATLDREQVQEVEAE